MTGLIVITGFVIAFWIISSDRKSVGNKWLFSGILLSILFITSDYLTAYTPKPFSTFLIRASFGFAALVIGSLYFFILNFPTKSRNNPYISSIVVVYSVFSAFLSFFTKFIISNTESVAWGTKIIGGGLDLIYDITSIAIVILILLIAIKKYQRSTRIDRQKISLFLMGVAVFSLSEIVFTLLIPAVNLGQFGYFGDYSIMIFFGFTAYAIVKHHLFDVRLAIVRSVTYTLVLITLAAIYLVIAFALSMIFDRNFNSPEQTISGVAISMVLAFAFQPIKRFFDKTTNKFFYKDNYDAGDFFARLNKTLSVTTDMRNLLERTAYEIGHTLKSEQAFFFINTADEHHISAGTPRHRQLPKADAVQLEAAQDMKNSDVIIASMLDTDDSVRRLMLSHRIELILPLIQSNAVIGYLCLGDHLTSGYTNRDIKALATISNELIIAIQNALAVEEIRELNATLQQRIANATKELRASNTILRQLDKVKDEFVSMASHQLRTPLTSVKGYLSMVLEGDVGKITDPQRKFLNEAFMSSERMVHLINDFLNVSRLQTGKFVIDKVPTDLSKIVEQEINSLKPNALARKLKYLYKPPKKFPILNIDEGKIRQVIMNFADNALYYSHEDSSIEIGLSIDNNEVLFTVKDTGIGVPVGEQAHLFTKFYRASNARKQRPDGTGVGLFLAKKVVEAHGGKVIFESVEGEGSTFGFRLPIEIK